MVEQQLADAARNGELDVAGPLKGKPIADLDVPRNQGWWADQFVQRERSHDRRKTAEAAAARARSRFWRAASIDELRELVGAANDAIATANINLVARDRLVPFDADDIVDRWHDLRR
jgi:hypothetical protein